MSSSSAPPLLRKKSLEANDADRKRLVEPIVAEVDKVAESPPPAKALGAVPTARKASLSQFWVSRDNRKLLGAPVVAEVDKVAESPPPVNALEADLRSGRREALHRFLEKRKKALEAFATQNDADRKHLVEPIVVEVDKVAEFSTSSTVTKQHTDSGRQHTHVSTILDLSKEGQERDESLDELICSRRPSKVRRLLIEEASEQMKPLDANCVWNCSLYCSLFPVGYEFEVDTLIQLWIAEGFIEERTNERLEDTGSLYFHYFVSKGIIVPSSCDFIDGRPKYKVSDNKDSQLQQFSSNGYLLVEDVVPGFELSDKLGDASPILHLSLHGKIDFMTFEVVKKCEYLRTLLINPRHDSCIKQVPRDLFLRLNLLRTLNLSQTCISELPSSIANVKSLRYIDVSQTPITKLPESIDSLSNLQTLKLRGCTCFVALPKGMKNLTNLRHLDLDIVGQLTSMPPRMGNLINLQNLSAFLVDRHDGYHISELKNLNNLRGEICISRLERVPDSEEAMEAALMYKNYLNKLELRWSDLRVEEAGEEEGILECLRPHFGLKELHILFYGGSKLPSWIGHPLFADLAAITLHKFKNCQFLPSLGELPSLKFLYISEMNTVCEVNYRFCRNREDQGHHAFPKLEILKFDVMLKLEGWMGVQIGDFPSLVKLTLVYCPKLNTLPSLSCLNSLKHLEIKHCPKLISMPNEGLPSSLEFLLIKDCPELNEQCSKGKGQDWSKIAHVPSIWVDNQEISAS